MQPDDLISHIVRGSSTTRPQWRAAKRPTSSEQQGCATASEHAIKVGRLKTNSDRECGTPSWRGGGPSVGRGEVGTCPEKKTPEHQISHLPRMSRSHKSRGQEKNLGRVGALTVLPTGNRYPGPPRCKKGSVKNPKATHQEGHPLQGE